MLCLVGSSTLQHFYEILLKYLLQPNLLCFNLAFFFKIFFIIPQSQSVDIKNSNNTSCVANNRVGEKLLAKAKKPFKPLLPQIKQLNPLRTVPEHWPGKR